MKTIADEIIAALSGEAEFYYRLNPKPAAELVYPYTTFDYSYTPSTVTDGGQTFDVALELDLFDRWANALRLLAAEERIVNALKRYRALRENAWSVATMDQALSVPTLVDNLHRRQLQFTIRMTLRK